MGLNRITLAAVSKRLKVEKDGSRETGLDVIEIVQAREDGSLVWAGRGRWKVRGVDTFKRDLVSKRHRTWGGLAMEQ